MSSSLSSYQLAPEEVEEVGDVHVLVHVWVVRALVQVEEVSV